MSHKKISNEIIEQIWDKPITTSKRKELIIRLLNCMKLPCINNPANMKAKLLTYNLMDKTLENIKESINFLENTKQNLIMDGEGLGFIINSIQNIEKEQNVWLKQIEEAK